MNLWQMDSKASGVKSRIPGSLIDGNDKRHYSIHPISAQGRSMRERSKKRGQDHRKVD